MDTGLRQPPGVRGQRPSRGAAWWRSLRPRQWPKNGLVLAAPTAAGVILEPPSAGRAAAALLIFCLASSGTYLLNDVVDVVADRQHPVKRHRPIAAGEISREFAIVAGIVALLVAVGLGAFLSWEFALVVVVYGVSTVAYSLGLKRVAVVEMVILAAGFVLRAVAGGIAVDVPISGWFLAVTSLVALLVVAGKRSAEGQLVDPGQHRRVLQDYPQRFLDATLAMTAGAATVTYTLWSIETTSLHPGGAVWFHITSALFLVCLLRYLLLVFQGRGGAPEDLLIGDAALRTLAAAWAAVFVVGVVAS